MLTARLLRRFYRRYRVYRVGRDRTTRALVRKGVYSADYLQQDPELQRIRTPVPYSFGSAVKHILILSLMLWWIPTFGQMIAGYVGGRRAGSHWKAVLAALVPVVIILGLNYIGDVLYPEASLGRLYALPGMAMKAIAAGVPELAPYILFVLGYLTTFAQALQGTATMGLNGYMVTIIFAYIGGLMGEQSLRELDYERWRPQPSTVVNYWAPQGESRWHPFRNKEQDEVEAAPKPTHWVRAAPARPALAPKAAPPLRPTRLDREALVQKLVARALRDYEAGN